MDSTLRDVIGRDTSRLLLAIAIKRLAVNKRAMVDFEFQIIFSGRHKFARAVVMSLSGSALELFCDSTGTDMN